MSSPSEPTLVARARKHPARLAITDEAGEHSYGDLLEASGAAAAVLLDGARDLDEARVAFLTPSSFSYTRAQWGIWRAGGIAVPLCGSHPRPELEHVLEDAGVSVVIGHPTSEPLLRPLVKELGLRFLSTLELGHAAPVTLPGVDSERRAMIVYTSGTTSRPKGAVSTHRNIQAQIETLVTAWEWSSDDRILQVLPLHHVHGIINVLGCALWSGAVCEMLPGFDAREVWQRFSGGDLTLFMAVPTIYSKLISAWENATSEERAEWSDGCSRLRLMVSGSAALPVQVLEKWREITGHMLLERYGMTEIGMALSNPLRGTRVPGSVGAPLPGIEVRVVDEDGRPLEQGATGEIQVRGRGVFLEYWGEPAKTEQAFRDEWFRTGDVAVVENGVYRILGRDSVDIIKSGGYKISALEVEETLRQHPAIDDCAVVGVPDEEWGERVAGALVLRPGSLLTLEDLREWARARIGVYKVPTICFVLESLPRNALGKVTKPEVTRRIEAADLEELR